MHINMVLNLFYAHNRPRGNLCHIIWPPRHVNKTAFKKSLVVQLFMKLIYSRFSYLQKENINL